MPAGLQRTTPWAAGGTRRSAKSFAVPGSASTSYWSDSGRIYGQARTDGNSDTVTWCQEDFP